MSNEIKSLSIESKSNGIILIISMDHLLPENNVTAWQATSGWFYLTIFAVKGDSANIKINPIPTQIQNFQIIDNGGSVQISLQIKEPIHDYNFIYDSENNVIISNLHYSTEYFAKIDDIKKNNQQNIIKTSEKKYSNWFYKTGLALTILGLADNPDSMNNTSKVGIGILILTRLYDITVKKFY